MDANDSFVFPPDRFPSWNPEPNPPLAAEEFGPSLSFDPQSSNFRKFHINLENPGFQFKPTEFEIRSKIMEISYNVVTDVTNRPGQLSTNPLSGWEKTVWRHCNVARKIEHDWAMGYLARIELDGIPNVMAGLLEYRFNLSESGLKVKNLSLRLPHKTYRDGKVRVLVCSREDYTVLLDTQELKQVVRARGWDDFIIRVELSGQDDVVAYQNAQLFRQPLNQQFISANWKDPFKVIVEME